MLRCNPRHDYVLIEPTEPASVPQGKLDPLVPFARGRVYAVGPGRINYGPDGSRSREPMGLRAGLEVIFDHRGAKAIIFDGKTFALIQEVSIVAVISREDE